MRTIIAAFADRCIQPGARDRFAHEAMKRPDRLHERICHHAAEIFEPKFLSGSVSFARNEKCLLLASGKGFQEATWDEVKGKTGLYGGLLVISLEAAKFYAESEGTPKVQVWAGEY